MAETEGLHDMTASVIGAPRKISNSQFLQANVSLCLFLAGWGKLPPTLCRKYKYLVWAPLSDNAQKAAFSQRDLFN